MENSKIKTLLILAMDKTNDKLRQNPNFSILVSIKNQLDFIGSKLVNNEIPTEEEKSRIILGVQAIREFEATDSSFADILCDLDFEFKKLN